MTVREHRMTNQAKRYIAGIVTLWLLVVTASVIWNVKQSQNSYLLTYLENGRSLFNLIVVAREWNAMQGGVYLPVTENIQPNPYLEVPNRDVTTTEGLDLTLVNPAYMTRLIGELADKKDNVKFHITSLNPIRPMNAPTEWEASALETFEHKGQLEYYSYNGAGTSRVFRFMAPLITQQSCLKCHAKQGYQVGDVRGGISITFPVNVKTPWALIISHMLIALAGCGFIFIYGKKLDHNMHTLEDLSNVDGLTRIRNRRYFDESLGREFSYCQRNHTPLSVAMCDLDEFKAYNDAYGHQAGDDCLKQVAQALSDVLKRPGDLVARYGGEEFCIILPVTDAVGARLIGNLLQSRIEALQIPHKTNKVSPYVTISIGVAAYHGDELNRNELLKKADLALYTAKHRGKNCVVVFEDNSDRV
jgi:diguanylate cyclase (GGDEF)-like protein